MVEGVRQRQLMEEVAEEGQVVLVMEAEVERVDLWEWELLEVEWTVEEVDEPAASSVESVDAFSLLVDHPARLRLQLPANYPEGTQADANYPQDTRAFHWDRPVLRLECFQLHAINRDSQCSVNFLAQPAESDVFHA